MSEIWFSVCRPWESALDRLKESLTSDSLNLNETIQIKEYSEDDRAFLFIKMQEKNKTYINIPELLRGVLCEDIAGKYLSSYCTRWLKFMLNDDLERFLLRTCHIRAPYDLAPNIYELTELLKGGGINLDGFFRFRMREHRREIERKVDFIAQDILLEREYFDFLDIIKEYANSLCAEKRTQKTIYLSGEKGKLRLYGEDMIPIDWVSTGLPKEATPNDIILNTLIESAPWRIVLCGDINHEDSFIEAILYLFGDKIQISDKS